MIPTIDQIKTETLPRILGCLSRCQHHKRIRTVRRSSGNRCIDNLSADHIMIIAIHLICPISVKGREYIIFCNLIKLHAHQALQFVGILYASAVDVVDRCAASYHFQSISLLDHSRHFAEHIGCRACLLEGRTADLGHQGISFHAGVGECAFHHYLFEFVVTADRVE